jgi:hypothetical protein
MRKLTLFLAMTGMFLSLSVISFSQDTKGPRSTGIGKILIMHGRAGELDCSVNSIFSQPPVDMYNGYFSDESTAWSEQKLFENFYGLTSPIGGITFWGILFNGGDCYSGGSDDFIVTFYQDNAGTVGTMVQSFSFSATPIVTGSILAGAQLLKYDLTIPSNVSLATGWVMVYRLNPGNTNCVFAWANTTTGDNNIGYNQLGGDINYFADNLAFCLTGPTESVPLSNWALIIGIGLILTFAVVRFRKMV